MVVEVFIDCHSICGLEKLFTVQQVSEKKEQKSKVRIRAAYIYERETRNTGQRNYLSGIARSFVRWLVRSFVRSFVRSLVRSLARSSIHSCEALTI